MQAVRTKREFEVSAARRPNSVLISGGSSGIGEALARAYAAAGVHLALTGRNEDRLARVAEACRNAGAEVSTAAIDVRDREAMRAWIEGIDDRTPLDLAIANAGVSGGTGGEGESDEQRREILSVNIDGAINTLAPAIERMRARGRGQVAVMSSLAAFRGFPGAPAYCASKACVRVWAEGLRGDLATDGVGVSVICPGYVRSRMTEGNDFPMPFLMDAEKAAEIVRNGLARNRARIAFPWPLACGVWLLNALPPGWTDALLARMPRKV